MSNFSDFIGGGGSASQINEVVTLNNTADTVTLSDDRVYLKGGVFETDLSVYPNAYSRFKSVGTEIYVGGQGTQPRGVAWDGTYIYQANSASNNVNKYDVSGNFVSTFSVASQDASPVGIVWDGTHFWVLGQVNKRVFKYSASGTYQNVSFLVSSELSAPSALAWDGTHFWVGGSTSDAVFKYNAAGTYQNVSFSVAGQLLNIWDLTWDGSNFWAVGSQDPAYAYKYNASGVYQSRFPLPTITTFYAGIASAGDDLWIGTGAAPYLIYKHSIVNGVTSDNSLGGQNYVRVV